MWMQRKMPDVSKEGKLINEDRERKKKKGRYVFSNDRERKIK